VDAKGVYNIGRVYLEITAAVNKTRRDYGSDAY